MSTERRFLHPSHRETARFIQALGAMTALPKVARIEVLVFAGDGETTFAIGDVLTSLWSAEGVPAPRHEVVWAKRPGSAGGLALTAFDVDGRVLHRQAT